MMWTENVTKCNQTTCCKKKVSYGLNTCHVTRSADLKKTPKQIQIQIRISGNFQANSNHAHFYFYFAAIDLINISNEQSGAIGLLG